MHIARVLLGVAGLCVMPAIADAQRFGAQANWGFDSDLGVGGRFEMNMTGAFKQEPFSKAVFVGSFDYYFIDCATGVDCSYWEVNPGVVIPVSAQNMKPYFGAGLNLARASASISGISSSSTETGINLIGGLRFALSGMSSFAEARLSLGGGDQLALSFGVLFGGSRTP